MRRMDRPSIRIDPLVFQIDQSRTGMARQNLGNPLDLFRSARHFSCLSRAARPYRLAPAPSVTSYC